MTDPSRQVVVLREGPPQRRGLFVDILVGILGVALLATAVALVDILPEEEIPPKQFQITYPESSKEFAVLKDQEGGLSYVERDPVAEGTVTEYEVPIDRDNLYQFKITFGASMAYQNGFTADDVPSSLPDRFLLELLSPNGTVVNTMEIVTGEPYFVQNITGGQTPYYTTDPVSETGTFRFAAKPADGFLSVNNSKATKADALRLLGDKTFQSKGTWIIRVTMVSAGDCPQPAADPESIRRAAVCQEATDGTGIDAGNPYAIQKVVGFYYDIVVRDPDDPADAPGG